MFRDATKEHRAVVSVLETKKSISFLRSCVDVNILAPIVVNKEILRAGAASYLPSAVPSFDIGKAVF
jgi:hypothetical protein